MTPDALGGDMANPQSLNRYAYVGNNPLSFTDPLGLFFRAGPCLEDPFAPGCNGGGGSDYIAPGTCAEILIDGFDTWQNTCGGRILIPNIPNIPNVASGNRPGRPPKPAPKPGNPQTLPQSPTPQQKYKQCVAQAKAVEISSLAAADFLTGAGILAVEGGSVFATWAAVSEGAFEGASFLEAFDTAFDFGPKLVLVDLAKSVPYVSGVIARTQAMETYDRAVANCQTQTGVYLPTGD